jgi:hypothetical protein
MRVTCFFSSFSFFSLIVVPPTSAAVSADTPAIATATSAAAPAPAPPAANCFYCRLWWDETSYW